MRKRKRLLLCLGLLAALGLCALGAWHLAAPRHRINREGFAALRDGMTLAEVEAALGGPAGDYCGRRQIMGEIDPDEVPEGFKGNHAGYAGYKLYLRLATAWVPGRPPTERKVWFGDGAIIAVDFWSESGVVCAKDYIPAEPAPESLSARFRRWLRL